MDTDKYCNTLVILCNCVYHVVLCSNCHILCCTHWPCPSDSLVHTRIQITARTLPVAGIHVCPLLHHNYIVTAGSLSQSRPQFLCNKYVNVCGVMKLVGEIIHCANTETKTSTCTCTCTRTCTRTCICMSSPDAFLEDESTRSFHSRTRGTS